jgi:hypothetical protein
LWELEEAAEVSVEGVDAGAAVYRSFGEAVGSKMQGVMRVIILV